MRIPSLPLGLLILCACEVDGTDSPTRWRDAGPSPERQLLDPALVPKFVEPLVIPGVMPWVDRSPERTQYRIAVRQIEQQMLPSGFPTTTVWAYGAPQDPSTFHSPSLTIEARRDEPIQVTWVNELVDDQGRFLPHLLPVDPTLHWANPRGPIDARPEGAQPPYDGPVPIVPHLHGAHSESVSDGMPDAWWLPDAVDIPEGYARQGSHYGTVLPAEPGSAVFSYSNDIRGATRWYHDHAFGLTRLNVYAGLAGFWLVRDAVEDALGLPGPAPSLGDPAGTSYYEIPLAIQDRSFWADGGLYYPDTRAAFDGYEGPYLPDSEVSPVWNPEVFGDTIVVNGRTWPYLEVEPRLYRFRVLNGSNSRTLVLDLDDGSIDFVQLGIEGGLLADAPVPRDTVTLMSAERADLLVDFSSRSPGDRVVLRNLGPDEPFGGPEAGQEPADPETTGQVLQFRVVAHTGQGDLGQIPESLPPIAPLATALPPRDLTLNEEMADTDQGEIPVEAELGTAELGDLDMDDPTTEVVGFGDTEIWRLLNLTEDAHPIHLHMISFQVIDRVPFDAEAYAEAQVLFLDGGGPQPRVEDYVTGPPLPAEADEHGWTDTVTANPDQITRIIATFDIAGRFVWHCHVLEHEDNAMMRPYEVGAAP